MAFNCAEVARHANAELRCVAICTLILSKPDEKCRKRGQRFFCVLKLTMPYTAVISVADQLCADAICAMRLSHREADRRGEAGSQRGWQTWWGWVTERLKDVVRLGHREADRRGEAGSQRGWQTWLGWVTERLTDVVRLGHREADRRGEAGSQRGWQTWSPHKASCFTSQRSRKSAELKCMRIREACNWILPAECQDVGACHSTNCLTL
jgi:hypothetical protein